MYQYHVEKKLYHFTYTGPTIYIYIYMLQFKRGSENQPINRPLSAGTAKSNCVASTRRLAEGISHAPWSLVTLNGLCTASRSKLPTFFQLLDATCKFLKKRKMKPFEVRKEIPTPLQSNLHFGPLFFETKRRWCTSPRWGSLSWPLWCRRWGRRYRCPFEIGQYLCRKAAWLAMVRICWCFLWGKSGCQSFNTWPISQMTWTWLEIQITSALSFFIKSRRPSSHVHPRAKTASMYFQTGCLLAFPNKQGLIPQKLQFQPRSTCVVHQEVFVDSHGCVTIDSHLPCSRAYPRVAGDRMKASHWHGWF